MAHAVPRAPCRARTAMAAKTVCRGPRSRHAPAALDGSGGPCRGRACPWWVPCHIRSGVQCNDPFIQLRGVVRSDREGPCATGSSPPLECLTNWLGFAKEKTTGISNCRRDGQEDAR